MDYIEIKYEVELIKSIKGNDCIKFTIIGGGGEKRVYYGQPAIDQVEKNEYMYGKELLDRLKGLKEITNLSYLKSN